MASAWGSSWLTAWGNSWGDTGVAPEPEPAPAAVVNPGGYEFLNRPERRKERKHKPAEEQIIRVAQGTPVAIETGIVDIKPVELPGDDRPRIDKKKTKAQLRRIRRLKQQEQEEDDIAIFLLLN